MESSIAPAAAQAPIVSVSDMISNVAAKTKIEATAPVETPSVQIVRNAPAMPLAETPQAPVVGSEGPEGGEVGGDLAAAEPTGEIVLDDGEITLTAQRNADGTFKSKLDPSEKHDFTIKDKTTGDEKKYSKTLPDLMRLAKDGVTLQTKVQELTPEVEYYRTNVPQWQQKVTTLQEQLDAQRELNIELLTAGEDQVVSRREQYAAEMSPEKQLARLKAERQAEQQAAQQSAKQQQHAKIASSFVESRIAPALSAAEAIVGQMAVTGAVTHYTNDLVAKSGEWIGRIPPANWPEMERRINSPNGPFQTWLTTEKAKRTQDSDTVTAARKAAEEQQRKAQAVVNDQGRLMAPIGRSQGGEPQSNKSNQPKTVRGVIDSLNNRPVPA